MIAERFVLELGRALHAYGSPSYRVEDVMGACSRSLGVTGSFFATPTAIFASIDDEQHSNRTALMRVEPGGEDLAKLSELYRIGRLVMAGTCTAGDALARVRDLVAAPPTHGRWLPVPGMMLSAATACVILGGSVREMWVAAVVGLVVAALGLAVPSRAASLRLYEPVACAIAAFLGHAFAVWLGGVDATLVTLAAIIIMLPGLTLTTALTELALRHLASGSARLLGAMTLLMTIAIGVGIGQRLASRWLGGFEMPAMVGQPVWLLGAALVCSALAFTVLLRAAWGQLPWVLGAVLIAWFGYSLGREVLGADLGAFVGALLVSMAANGMARLTRCPAAVMRTPGLLILVPGSLGFQGLTRALAEDSTTAMGQLLDMLLIGCSLAAGMLFAALLLPPPRDGR